MAIYLLPSPKNGHVERPLRKVATSSISKEYLPMPELRAASDVRPGKRLANWKARQVKYFKGVMRWV